MCPGRDDPIESPIRDVGIGDESIRLGQFLKLANVVESGAEAKDAIAFGAVRVNGEPELRRGRRLVPGDRISLGAESLRVATGDPDEVDVPW